MGSPVPIWVPFLDSNNLQLLCFLTGNVIYYEEIYRPVLTMADDLQALIDDVLASEADNQQASEPCP